MADSSTWRRKHMEPVHPWGRRKEVSCFSKMATQALEGSKASVRWRLEKYVLEPFHPWQPVIHSPRSGKEVAGRSPEPSVSGTPRGQETSQTEIRHLRNMFTVAGSGQMHSLSRNLLGRGALENSES